MKVHVPQDYVVGRCWCIHLVLSVFLIFTLSMTAVMGALSHTRPTSARNLELGFSSAFQLRYFIAEAQIAKPPAPELVSHFLNYFSSCKESLVLQY